MTNEFAKFTDEQLNKIVNYVAKHLTSKDSIKMAQDMFGKSKDCSIVVFPDFFSMTKKERREYHISKIVRYNKYFPAKVNNAIKHCI